MKRRWFGAAAVVVAACAISVFSARRIEAQYSSPVKVVNSTAAPAITSRMDDHGRIPYQAEVDNGVGPGGAGSSCVSQDQCDFTFGPVPSGHRLVIEHISGLLPLLTGNQVIAQLFNPQTGGHYTTFIIPTTTTWGAFDAATLVYLDSQQSVNVHVSTSTLVGFSLGATYVTVSGYMLDCTAAPCAAIAH